jgi:hypothetical protein
VEASSITVFCLPCYSILRALTQAMFDDDLINESAPIAASSRALKQFN